MLKNLIKGQKSLSSKHTWRIKLIARTTRRTSNQMAWTGSLCFKATRYLTVASGERAKEQAVATQRVHTTRWRALIKVIMRIKM
jgi:hypothetical protein